MVVFHVGGDLDADMARADDAGDDVLDALAHAGPRSRRCAGPPSAAVASAPSLPSPPASRLPWSSTMATRPGCRPATAAATRCWMALTWPRSSRARVFSTTEAVGACGVAREDLPLRDDQMHARAVDAVDGLDGAGKLAFQRAQAVDVLDEGGGAEGVGLVEDLVADAGGGQVLRGQLHAQLGDLVGRDQDRAAVALGVIGHVHGVELGGDRGGVARLEPGKQDRFRRLGDHARDIEKECGERGGDTRHDAEPRGAHTFEESGKPALRTPGSGRKARNCRAAIACPSARQTLPGFGKGALNAACELGIEKWRAKLCDFPAIRHACLRFAN